MTRPRYDKHGTEFGLWLRNHSLLDSRKYGFDAENLDYIWFNYRKGWLITIEEKRYNANQTVAQRDTHNIVRQMFEYSSANKFDTMRGKREIYYRGHYIIKFEKTNPDDSKWIKINGSKHNKYELLILLRYGKLITIKSNLNKPQDIFAELSSKIKNISFPDIIKIISSE